MSILGIHGTTGVDALVPVTAFSLKTSNTVDQQNTTTVLDSSSNNAGFSIPAGSTGGALSSCSPFASAIGHWSVQMNTASADNGSLLIASNSALSAASGVDFTWECYAMRTNVSAATSNLHALACLPTGGQVILRLSGDASGGSTMGASYTGNGFGASLKHGQWAHIALVRSSGVVTMFINGKAVASAAYTNAVSFSGGSANIGNYNGGANQEWSGYISNLRITIGTAVYTSNFTPSKSPLTVLANTKFLGLCGPSLLDYSGNGNKVTIVAGSPKFVPVSPFQAGSSYVHGTSVGSFTSNLNSYVVSGLGLGTTIGTGNFTVDGWVHLTSATVNAPMIAAWTNNQNASSAWAITQGSTDATMLRIVLNNGGTPVIVQSATGALHLNAWMHIAMTRANGTLKAYVNGVEVINVADTSNISGNPPMSVMNYSAGGVPSVGMASNVRYLQGSALYTAAFTPPTAPSSATGSTITLNFQTAGVYDQSACTPILTTGNARVNTSVVKYGASSLYFDGTGDYLQLSNMNSQMQFGNGDFTVEMWVYIQNASGAGIRFIDTRSSTQTTNWGLMRNTSNQLVWTYASTTIAGSTLLSTSGVWTHIAYSRCGSTGRLFIDGVLAGSGSDSNNYNIITPVAYVGSLYTGGNYLQGYMQGLRILKYARTGNFTPETGY